MIDEKGIMYIIDLGTAKILDIKTHNRTFTIIGKCPIINIQVPLIIWLLRFLHKKDTHFSAIFGLLESVYMNFWPAKCHSGRIARILKI